jgi:hypothetical protein
VESVFKVDALGCDEVASWVEELKPDEEEEAGWSLLFEALGLESKFKKLINLKSQNHHIFA